jgi:plasmid stability protein
MTNLTIALQETLLREARIQAVTEGTTVDALIREYLTGYVSRGRRRQAAAAAYLDIARRYAGTIERFTRDDLHER